MTLVDNASVDNSVEIVRSRFPQVNIIESKKNAGFAGGCNLGLNDRLAGDADFFVFANSDITAHEEWLHELVAAAKSDGAIGICQSLVYLAEKPDIINTAGNEAHYLAFGFCGHYLEKDHGQFEDVTDIPFASGAAMLIKRQVLEEIGRFDEDLFLYQEDLDISWRARLAGYRIVLASRSHAYHHYSFDRNKDKYYYLERNRLLVSMKNYSARSLLVLAPAFIGAEIAMLGYAVADGWSGYKLREYRYLVRNIGKIRSKRRRAQASRVMSDGDIVSFWTDRMGFPDLQDSRLTQLANPVSRAYWRLAHRLL